jgi:tRNA-specific 2-thiouridylase
MAGSQSPFPSPHSPSVRGRILVALSGGVDSSVAALLLKRQGLDVAAAYMKNWINEENVIGRCPWQEDIEDARRVCAKVGIEFTVVNLMRDYRERVVQYLLDGYARGLTPNPDAMCNREMKFGVFRSWAVEHGFTSVATGHYARREGTSILEGTDKNKDQSYFLALLGPDQVRDAVFPIGHLLKPEVRSLARQAGLPTADKKDSQGICFIGEVKMADFLTAFVPEHPGPIVRAGDGLELGRHRGLHYYTLGQRRGMGVPSNAEGERYVVVGKRAADNALLVAFDLDSAAAIEGRVRYRDPRVPVEFIPEGGGSATIRFRSPQRALASGQVLALYDGERLLGGGIYC